MRVFVVPGRLLYYGDIRIAAKLLQRTVDRAIERTGAERVNVVGMSLGGLIGYYYLTCLGGADRVARFVSVGGPINGCSAAKIGLVPPLCFAKAIAQSRPNSDVFREIHAAPFPAGVRMFAVGAKGDAITNRDCWAADGFEAVESPYGVFPVGHWALFVHPANLRIVLDLLREQ